MLTITVRDIYRCMDAAKLIERLGGPTKAADFLTARLGEKFTQPRVSNWLVRGVPWRWRDPIKALLDKQPSRRRTG